MIGTRIASGASAWLELKSAETVSVVSVSGAPEEMGSLAKCGSLRDGQAEGGHHLPWLDQDEARHVS